MFCLNCNEAVVVFKEFNFATPFSINRICSNYSVNTEDEGKQKAQESLKENFQVDKIFF